MFYFFTYVKINGFFSICENHFFYAHVCENQCFLTYAKINVFNLNVWKRNFTVSIHMLQRILFPRTFVTLLLELLRQTTFHKKVRKKK